MHLMTSRIRHLVLSLQGSHPERTVPCTYYMTHLQSVTLGIFLPKKATIILLLSVTYLQLQIIKKTLGFDSMANKLVLQNYILVSQELLEECIGKAAIWAQKQIK